MVDYLANGLHHYSMYYFRSITMTPENQKALKWVRECILIHDENINGPERLEALRVCEAALTAQAEAQPADDDVREAAIRAEAFMLDVEFDFDKRQMQDDVDTLIRAATAPKNTDAEKEKALEAHRRLVKSLAEAHKRHPDENSKDAAIVEAALRGRAAVPQEVVDALKEAVADADYRHTLAMIDGESDTNIGSKRAKVERFKSALAMLQQKGGE